MSKFQNWSLKKKWTVSTAVMLALSYTIMCFILYVVLHTWLIHNEEKNAIRTADDLSTFFNNERSTLTINELKNNHALMKAIVTQEQTVRILNLDGVEIIGINSVAPIAKTNVTYEQLLATNVSKQKLAGIPVYVVERIVYIGPFQGYMQLIHPLTAFNEMMHNIFTTMVIVGACALLCVIVVSRYLSELLIRPLQQLRDSMALVKEEGLTARQAYDYYADDEIGDVMKMYDQMLLQLNESFIRQQRFVADASHELRTPIQAIEGHLSMLNRWGKNEPDVLHESLALSLTEVKRMKKLIEELLQFAKNEENIEAETNVDEVLTHVLREISAVFPQAVLQVENDQSTAMVAVSFAALTQILRNLVENAIRYTDGTPIVRLSTAQMNDAFYIEIQDNGIGIAESHLPYIFDRFYRVDSSRQQNGGGNGLGLSITKMLADKYHIKITVNSKIQHGTTFLLEIPLKK